MFLEYNVWTSIFGLKSGTTVDQNNTKVDEASKQQSETEAGPSEPTKVKPLEAEETKMAEPTLVEETDTAAPEASSKALDYIVRHASGKRLSEEEIFEANHYARDWSIRREP